MGQPIILPLQKLNRTFCKNRASRRNNATAHVNVSDENEYREHYEYFTPRYFKLTSCAP